MYKRDFGILLLSVCALYLSLQYEGAYQFKKAWCVQPKGLQGARGGAAAAAATPARPAASPCTSAPHISLRRRIPLQRAGTTTLMSTTTACTSWKSTRMSCRRRSWCAGGFVFGVLRQTLRRCSGAGLWRVMPHSDSDAASTAPAV